MRLMRRLLGRLAAACTAVLLVACGAAATPTAPPPEPARHPGPPAGSPGGPVAASRAPLLYYRGRAYLAVGVGGAGPSPAEPALRADRPLGRTFARWQSNGLYPAGTPLYSVAGHPVERLLAVQADGQTTFFEAREGFVADLAGTQVVLGTVTSFGPSRWTTPDGQPPRPGSGTWASLYTPARVAVERVLQGRLPADGELEVRQRGGSDGEAAATMLGPVLALEPGARVILFLSPGQWGTQAPGEPSAEPPPGDYYWTGPDRAYRVEGARVTPLGVADAAAEAVPLAEFEAGLAEAFRGVEPLDPRGPPPTPPPAPAPAPTPTPRARAGEAINLAREYGLDRAGAIHLKGPALPGGSRTIAEPERVRAVVAALDRPLTVAEVVAGPPAGLAAVEDIVGVVFQFAEGPSVVLEFDRRAGTLTVRDEPAPALRVPAPPDFARTLGLEEGRGGQAA